MMTGLIFARFSYRCAVHRITVWGNVLDPYGHDVTAAKLAIEGQVKKGESGYLLRRQPR